MLFCGPALWSQGLLSARKAPELGGHGSLWFCSTEGFIIHNLLKSLPQQLPKIPLVRNAIMRRSGCFVTHTVSLKRFFFFKQMFSRRIQRFSKATAKTEQLIILFPKGLPLHRRFLYLKTLKMLRFTMLSCCTWPLVWEEVGNGWIKHIQHDWACQILRWKAAGLQARPNHRS